jgi:hypothetical protein
MRPPWALDLRSLALFRALLGMVALLDLADRAAFLREHYSDEGVARRETVARFLSPLQLSLHAASGAPGAQVGCARAAGRREPARSRGVLCVRRPCSRWPRRARWPLRRGGTRARRAWGCGR